MMSRLLFTQVGPLLCYRPNFAFFIPPNTIIAFVPCWCHSVLDLDFVYCIVYSTGLRLLHRFE